MSQAIPSVAQPSLRTGAAWMLVGNAIYAGARWAIVVILAKFLTEDIVGQYGLAVAICLPPIVICRYGMRLLQATDARDDVQFGEYLAFTLIGIAVALLVVLAILFGFRPDVSVTVVILVAIWNLLESVSDLIAGVFQRRERLDWLAKAFILQGLAICALLWTALKITSDLRVGMLALVAAAALRLFAYELPAVRRLTASPGGHHVFGSLRPHISWSTFRRLLILGAPLAVVTFILALTESAPRYVLDGVLGKASLGVFVALYQLTLAVNLFVLSVSQTLASRLAILFVHHQRAEFIRLCMLGSLLAVGAGAAGVAVAMLFGEPILSIIYTPAYATEVGAFQILMLSSLFTGVGNIVGTALTSMRRFVIGIPFQVLRVVIVYFGCLWVAEPYGLEGVAWVLTAAALFIMVCYAALCAWSLRQRE